ncbi:MAG: tRNA (adenosine(37)-N6)-dimethylallyltransferase MiaA [Campylobacterota bacterium]
MKQLAIIGSTASGKSDLALSLAEEYNAIILSIDSLSIYREIDIASAKPSPSELSRVPHFGIDRLAPDHNANVITFIDEYARAREYAQREEKHLVIVGGSSFYLKSMIEGLSELPSFTSETLNRAKELLSDQEGAYAMMQRIDPDSMAKIAPADAYRTEKMVLIHLQTGLPPSEWFALHPPRPVLTGCPVFELRIDRNVLRERIALRTEKMIRAGLVDEVAELERLYGRSPNSMKAIGIVEVLEYLDGESDFNELRERITTHTAQLAKRQQTFNAHQFTLHASGSAETLYGAAQAFLKG